MLPTAARTAVYVHRLPDHCRGVIAPAARGEGCGRPGGDRELGHLELRDAHLVHVQQQGRVRRLAVGHSAKHEQVRRAIAQRRQRGGDAWRRVASALHRDIGRRPAPLGKVKDSEIVQVLLSVGRRFEGGAAAANSAAGRRHYHIGHEATEDKHECSLPIARQDGGSVPNTRTWRLAHLVWRRPRTAPTGQVRVQQPERTRARVSWRLICIAAVYHEATKDDGFTLRLVRHHGVERGWWRLQCTLCIAGSAREQLAVPNDESEQVSGQHGSLHQAAKAPDGVAEGNCGVTFAPTEGAALGGELRPHRPVSALLSELRWR